MSGPPIKARPCGSSHALRFARKQPDALTITSALHHRIRYPPPPHPDPSSTTTAFTTGLSLVLSRPRAIVSHSLNYKVRLHLPRVETFEQGVRPTVVHSNRTPLDPGIEREPSTPTEHLETIAGLESIRLCNLTGGRASWAATFAHATSYTAKPPTWAHPTSMRRHRLEHPTSRLKKATWKRPQCCHRREARHRRLSLESEHTAVTSAQAPPTVAAVHL